MGTQSYEFLAEVFDVAESLTDRTGDQISFGLGEIGPTSSLAQDDAGMGSYTVSSVVNSSIGAALDHVIALLSIFKASEITAAAPWTLLRGVIEPSSIAVWILNDTNRAHRRERALRVCRNDMHERSKWENDTGDFPTPPGKPATARMAEIDRLATSLILRPQQVAATLRYSTTVRDAGTAIGMSGAEALARWRECSGFAHGRTWPKMKLSQPVSAARMRDPNWVMLALTLDETYLKPVADLATQLLNKALSDYAEAADG